MSTSWEDPAPRIPTAPSRRALTRAGRWGTRIGGLVIGHGVREDVEEAHRFLMRTYRSGDRIVGFSRGACTARALVAMLRTVGLLRDGAENLLAGLAPDAGAYVGHLGVPPGRAVHPTVARRMARTGGTVRSYRPVVPQPRQPAGGDGRVQAR